MNVLHQLLKEIRDRKPLLHHITNHVTMNFLANGVLAAGGSPMMAHHLDEVEEAVMVSDALILNIGTIEPSWLASMIAAGKKAKSAGIPVVLDPVGVGLSKLRREAVQQILEEVKPDVICGNAAEISFLCKGDWSGKGVDGILPGNSDELALLAARVLETVIAITGEEDAVSDGKNTIVISGGHEMLSYVTGTGCFSSSLIGLFIAKSVRSDLSRLERTATALTMLGMSAERAKASTAGPGSFQMRLLDELYLLQPEHLTAEERWNRRSEDV